MRNRSELVCALKDNLSGLYMSAEEARGLAAGILTAAPRAARRRLYLLAGAALTLLAVMLPLGGASECLWM